MKIFTMTTMIALSLSAPAFAQHADLLLIRDDAGNLLTGQYDFDGGNVLNTSSRVFEGEFDEFGTSDEPGFNALSSGNVPAGFQALQGNTAVSFDANAFGINGTISNLFYWDGLGGVDFVQASNTMTISKAPSNLFSATLDASGSDVDGFTIDTTSSDGFLHKHIDFGLSDISESAHGFYLWSLILENEGSVTDPIFYVHGFGVHDEVAHELAIDWVGDNLVPAPASATAMLGCAVMFTRRRR